MTKAQRIYIICALDISVKGITCVHLIKSFTNNKKALSVLAEILMSSGRIKYKKWLDEEAIEYIIKDSSVTEKWNLKSSVGNEVLPTSHFYLEAVELV